MGLPDLHGKVAVITGASRGIGAGLAAEFAERGMRLGLCSRSWPALPDASDVVAERLDVTQHGALARFAEQVVQRLGPIDLWVNNAGILEPIAPIRDLDPAAFERNVRVNLTGVLLGTQAFVAHLRSRSGSAGGVLINISSGAAWHGYAGWAAYCASKAGVERLTETVQLEEGDAGLRAYAVAPGVVDTHMQELIRTATHEQFPTVERFLELKRSGRFNSIPFVSRHLLALAFDPGARSTEVLVRLPEEHPNGGSAS